MLYALMSFSCVLAPGRVISLSLVLMKISLTCSGFYATVRRGADVMCDSDVTHSMHLVAVVLKQILYVHNE